VTKVVHVIKMDLAEVAANTDIPLRTLRYVIDHQLVVGLRVSNEGRGNARFLSLFDATVLACAATLLEAGMTAFRVKSMISQYRGAKRTRRSGSFWQGLRAGRKDFVFGTSFVQVAVDVGGIHSLLKGNR
jgi:DNA-binding transcriptional MerR regulator